MSEKVYGVYSFPILENVMQSDKEFAFDCEGQCPKCGSSNIEYQDGTLDGAAVYYNVYCHNCDATFLEESEISYCFSTIKRDMEAELAVIPAEDCAIFKFLIDRYPVLKTLVKE